MSPTTFAIAFAAMIVTAGFSTWARLTLLSLRPSQLRGLLGRGKGQEHHREYLKEAEGLVLSTLVVANVVRAGTPLLIFGWLRNAAPRMPVGWMLAISFLSSAMSLLLFSELVPRVLVSSRREPAMKFAILPLLLLNLAALPGRVALQRLSLLIAKALGRNAEGLSLWPFRASPSMLWDMEGRETQLEENEKVLISSIFDMTETIVREVMVPRVDMHCLEQDETLAQVRQKILASGHSRFPVYEDSVDNIVGLFLVKDLLKYSSEEELAKVRVRELMHLITFVPETKNVSELLREFQQARRHVAVVVDEYGNTAGFVTIEDLVEQIVGKIGDEFDQQRKLYTETKDGAYIVDAKMAVSDVAKEIGLKLPQDSEYDTIGGFVAAALGKVPQPGETFQSNGVAVTVLEADDRRVHRVKVMRLPEEKIGMFEERGESE